jgi:hypothetical protein
MLVCDLISYYGVLLRLVLPVVIALDSKPGDPVSNLISGSRAFS